MAWTAEERREYLQSRGYIAPENDGFLGEFADSAAQSFIAGGRGLGATVAELTGNSSMQEYFQGVLDRNQQWNTPDDLGVGGYLGRAVGGAAGSTAATLTASVAGSLLGGPKAGLAAGIATAFSQTFGENIQRNRAAGYSEDKAVGMAFLESGLDTVIENMPFGIVGKSGKMIAQAGRLRNISAAGKRELLNKIGQRLSAEVGQKQAQNILVQWGKQAALSGLGEGGEEGLQYLNSYINQTLGGDPNAEFSVDEFANAVAQGILGGFALGGAMTAVTGDGIRRNPALKQLNESGEQVAPAVEVMPGNEAVAVDNTAVNSLLDELVAGVGEDFGVKVDYTDNYQGEAEVSDGFYDPKTDTIYLDRQDTGAELGITLGHELKHYLDRHHPELVAAFDKLWQSGQTEEGKAFFADMKKKLGLSDDLSQKEFGAEVFGRILERPDTMKYYAEALEKQSPGMGEKFIRIFRDFVAAIKKRLAGMYAGSPDMEQLFNNVTAMEQEAGNVLAQLRRRNGNSTQVENVVGAKGNTNVETVPVAAVNVDAQRFQFKSNTSKSSGVDESNKLGGDWDPRTAGNLYLWQDKNGKIYVVNGHHRLELAQRNNVENINAIIDREADGVTAEQARRNGVLINIRDGQGDVRDYAAFVRSEKLSEEEAKAQGVTARSKGRAGYTLGKSGDTLYEAYRNEMIPESKAVIIAEIAQGNEAIEYAGIKLATDRKLAGEALRQTLKLAAENTSGKKVESKQGSLFDMFDDSVLQEWEAIGKIAAGHIKEIRTRIEAAKDAIKNPEAAKSLGVKTSKGAEKLLAQAQAELTRWENYATDPELMAQLRNEAGIAPQEDVVGAENAQTTDAVETDSVVDTPVVKDNLTTEDTGDLLGISEMENTSDTTPSDTTPSPIDRPELNETFNQFYARFSQQIPAIIAKLQTSGWGDKLLDDLRAVADDAAVKAYQKYNPARNASLDTFATRVVKNAIYDRFDREFVENMQDGKSLLSLDQPNDEGGTLLDTVANTQEAPEYRQKTGNLINRYKKWKSTLKPRDQRLLDLSESGLPPSLIARSAGVGMTKAEVEERLKALAVAARTDGELQFRIKDVWTGSAASYDKPSLQYIGTGEGAQVFGWGLYGSESRAVAEWYAEMDQNRKNEKRDNIVDRLHIDGETFNEITQRLGDGDSKTQLAMMAISDMANDILHWDNESADDSNILLERLRGNIDYYADNPETTKEFWWGIYIPRMQEIIHKAGIKEGKSVYHRNLYRQTFWPNKDEDLLDWEDALTDEQRNKIIQQGDKEGIFRLDRDPRLDSKIADALQDIRKEIHYDDKTGSFFYKKFSDVLGSPKAASEFLYRAGIDGVTYIGGSSGVRNYVAFSDQDIQVDEHIQYRKKIHDGNKRNIEDVNNKFNANLDRQIAGVLPAGYIHQLGRPGDILLSTGVPDLPIELSAARLVKKSKQDNHPFDIAELKNLPQALRNPIAVFAYGDPEKAQNIIVEIQSKGKNYLVGLSLNYNRDGLDVNSIRGLFPKDLHEWLTWIQDGKSLYLNKEKVQNLIAQQRINLADVSYLDLNSIDNIIQNFENTNEKPEYRKKILHQQINPVIRDGKVRDEYADLLENKEYTPEKIAEWQDKAFEWILRRGGIVQAAKDILGNKAPADVHVAEIARRYILESDVFRNDILRADRTKLYELEIDARSEWGRTGRAMQLAAMQIKDIASVQAILNKLHKNMPSEDVQKLRNQIKKELDIDIFELPESIVNDKSKLDKILRAELAHKASWQDKFYEYWVNGLLSGPGTHVSNFLGNTANAVYELGLKRFTEALVNVASGRKDGATFGEFKEMLRAFNWDNAKKAFARAWDVELIDPAGKFLEHNQAAIGGKTGRVIRAPGRLLKAADAMARAIIEPMETAAYAYRMGVQEGLSGKGLADYIAQQLSDPESVAYTWANQRAKEITFQEDPGKSIRALMALKESDGAVGFALRVFLPFLKTPANILKQGVRKSVLGSGSLLVETGKLAAGKRKFDSEYISRVAEQIIAWGVAMTLYGLSDDDELPFITGSSAAYGSSEYGFKSKNVPPYSIRFGNTYLSYQRIEPFATGLAAVADALQAFRNARNGKDGTAVMKDLMNSVQQIILEKSYIDGISEAINFAKDPQRHGSRAATNLLSSALPNLYRQTVHALSEDVGESKSRNFGRDWWLDQFFIVTNRAGVTAAVPKIDYFGRTVKKDDWGDAVLSPLGRLLPFKPVVSNMDKAERLIWNYNQKNPDTVYYPNVPQGTFSYRGEKFFLAGVNYKEFAEQSGQLAHKQINNAFRAGLLNADNPSEKDIELIRKIFLRARKETQQKFIQQKKANKK